LVELKNGETYNGHMIACDNFMNITLRDVILTAPDGDKFYQMKEVYLKGNVVSTRVLFDWMLRGMMEVIGSAGVRGDGFVRRSSGKNYGKETSEDSLSTTHIIVGSLCERWICGLLERNDLLLHVP
jgi:U6 snRNA-associated Sm-like protein LSm4